MKHFYSVVACLIVGVALQSAASARGDDTKLWLPAIFGDHMVLQQGKDLPIWGKTNPGETVVVTVGDQTAETMTGSDGRWTVRLKPMPVTHDPVEVKVTSGAETRIFKDVLIGDVWFCSGQSNMGMGIGKMKNGKQVVAKADHPKLRIFLMPRSVSFEKAEDVNAKWIVCTPETLAPKGHGGFSAVGYYFGSALLKDLNRPIGLIGAYDGGTRIHAWTSLEGLQSFPDKRSDTAKRVQRFLKLKSSLAQDMEHHQTVLMPEWEAKLKVFKAEMKKRYDAWDKARAQAAKEGKPLPPRPKRAKLSNAPLPPDANYTLATVLFNAKVAPVAPYAITGAIWYQGEANCYPKQNVEYRQLLPIMIKEWRKEWGQGDFPFLYVQLPNMKAHAGKEDYAKYEGWWSTLRESQRLALTTPNTAMVVSIDVGDPNDLHPTVKKPIADRLVLAAKEHVYGDGVVGTSPLIKDAQLVDGKVSLSFTDIGSGLTIGKVDKEFNFSVAEGQPAHFELAGKDGKFVPAQAKIEGDTVIVWSDDLKDPSTIRYAWRNNPEPAVNLYNKEGLPASPFEINILRYLE